MNMNMNMNMNIICDNPMRTAGEMLISVFRP